MKLRTMTGDETRATLYIDGDPARLVTVRCHNAMATAVRIAHRVNTYEPMVEILRLFSSQEMGAKMVDVVVDSYEDEAKAAIVGQRLRAMINAVDVILKGIELKDIANSGTPSG